MKQVAARLPPVPEALQARLGATGGPGALLRRYLMEPQGDGPDGAVFRLHFPGRGPGVSLDRETLVRQVEADAKLWITSTARRVVFIHAGVVSWNGGALVLPGRSGAGKSTLVRALLNLGAVYFSDDYAVLDGRGLVWPCALPLAHRGPGGRRSLVDPTHLGARTAESGAPMRWVVETWFEKGARFAPSSLGPGETALRLLDNAPAARLRPAEVLRALARTCHGSHGWSGPRGDADGEAARILEWIEGGRPRRG